MNTLSIIVLVGAVLTVLYFSIMYRRKPKETPNEPEQADKAPITWDNTITIPGLKDYEITSKDLLYSDSDGDVITQVRFYGEIESLYYDKEYTKKYMYKEVLPIDFKLYLKLGEKKEYKIKYNVSSKNYWSQ